jgi:hypothetical protein
MPMKQYSYGKYLIEVHNGYVSLYYEDGSDIIFEGNYDNYEEAMKTIRELEDCDG